MTRSVVLLGPQRYDPIVGRVVDDLGVEGPIATVNAGWQEREPDDEELDGLLGGRSVNLHLYGRWLDVAEREPDFAAADAERRATVDEVQAVYLLRLHHEMQALLELRVRVGDRAVLDAAMDDAVRAVAALDAWHLDRVAEIHATFHERWPPHERPAVAEHREAVAEVLRSAGALAVAGGHVGVLLTALHLFNVGALVGDLPVVAWSAGAMAVTETVVLFHDHAVQASRNAEVFDRGLGIAREVVALPHARRRLAMDDRARMGLLAQRFAPARCVVLDDGAEVHLGSGDALPAGTPVVDADGEVRPHAA